VSTEYRVMVLSPLQNLFHLCSALHSALCTAALCRTSQYYTHLRTARQCLRASVCNESRVS